MGDVIYHKANCIIATIDTTESAKVIACEVKKLEKTKPQEQITLGEIML